VDGTDVRRDEVVPSFQGTGGDEGEPSECSSRRRSRRGAPTIRANRPGLVGQLLHFGDGTPLVRRAAHGDPARARAGMATRRVVQVQKIFGDREFRPGSARRRSQMPSSPAFGAVRLYVIIISCLSGETRCATAGTSSSRTGEAGQERLFASSVLVWARGAWVAALLYLAAAGSADRVIDDDRSTSPTSTAVIHRPTPWGNGRPTRGRCAAAFRPDLTVDVYPERSPRRMPRRCSEVRRGRRRSDNFSTKYLCNDAAS